MPGIPTIGLREIQCQSKAACKSAKSTLQLAPRRHVEFGQPFEQERSESARQMLLLAEIDDVERPSCAETLDGKLEHLPPVRNHK
jgi:hypothetical protein